jgi:hypothetical protein
MVTGAAALLDQPPFGLDQASKSMLFDEGMRALTSHHLSHCDAYRQMMAFLGHPSVDDLSLNELPPLPVRLFKSMDLLSCPRDSVVKTLTSSGTSGQQVSRIFLDRDNAAMQTRVLARIMADFSGGTRLPMLIVDSPKVIRDRKLFSARGAGILGFSMLGNDVTYALDEQMRIDEASVAAFCERHSDQRVVLFGFTSIVWQHLYLPLRDSGRKLPLNDAVLVHGGGWKKLADQAVDTLTFDNCLRTTAGVQRAINYYGMVEQTGSIFMVCEHGHLHCSNFSEVIVRRPDFSVATPGERGTLQLFSLLPTSYPGHNLLSEDEAVLLGVDDCPCGRKGRYFHVHGRISQAEIRGCSDTYRAA